MTTLFVMGLALAASFFAVDRLAKYRRDDEWRRWLNNFRQGPGPDGRDSHGLKHRRKIA